jgi:hypothetical protein
MKRFVVTTAALAVAGLAALACEQDRAPLGPAHDDPGTGPVFAPKSDAQFGVTGNGQIQSPPGGKHRQIFGIDIIDRDLDGVPEGKLVFRDQNPATRVDKKPLTLQSVSWSSITAIDGCADAGIEATGVLAIKHTSQQHRFRVIACDNGEPGRGRDIFSLEVFFDDGSTRFSWSGTLVGGNIQARGAPTTPPPTTGDLTITTVTTGDAQPASYTLSVTQPDGSTTAVTIGANATETFEAIPAGDYTLELTDVPGNCTVVNGTNPRTVTVPAGGAESTTFEVTCEAATPTGVRITGLGAIGTSSSATPGSDRQEFDFEATDAPDGRLVYRDWSFVRTDGSVPTITVDPATDPATGITSFVRTTATCVVFGGILRVSDTRELFDFTIEACDNARPGAGSDSFTFTVPAAPYMVSGTLLDGEITLSTF